MEQKYEYLFQKRKKSQCFRDLTTFFHVVIIKHFFDKLLCKLMLDRVWTS